MSQQHLSPASRQICRHKLWDCSALPPGQVLSWKMYTQTAISMLRELNRMGADIMLDGSKAVINGVRRLSGAPVMASDLRAGAVLVAAGMAAIGETSVSRVYHIDRGYESIEEKLNNVGADIRRVNDNDEEI